MSSNREIEFVFVSFGIAWFFVSLLMLVITKGIVSGFHVNGFWALVEATLIVWVVNLGCIDLNPHPIRADDTDHPDELRVDLDPGPGVPWTDVRSVAMVTREVLADHGLTGWPKTSGSRGIHVYARVERRWGYVEVRRAALALAREVERRAPEIAKQ